LCRAGYVPSRGRFGAAPVHLPLPEAPHRGYTGAPDLFAGQHADDEIAAPLADALAPHLREAALVLAPQAIGDHVDHRVVVDVVRQMAAALVLWWRDAPYVLRRAEAPSWHGVPAGVEETVHIAEYRETKIAAACCYTTQLGFQFGGAAHVATVLADAEECFSRTSSDGAGR
jgi:LmbE family N-acetylglucosaminyl deacetylase